MGAAREGGLNLRIMPRSERARACLSSFRSGLRPPWRIGDAPLPCDKPIGAEGQGMRTIAVWSVALALALAGSALAQAPPRPDAKLLAAVEACGPGARALLEQVVNIDSGTGDAEGLNKV